MLGFTLAALSDEEPHLHVVMNMAEVAVAVELPQLAGVRWQLAVDTAATPPDDIHPPGAQPLVQGGYDLRPRSVIVLEGYQQ